MDIVGIYHQNLRNLGLHGPLSANNIKHDNKDIEPKT